MTESTLDAEGRLIWSLLSAEMKEHTLAFWAYVCFPHDDDHFRRVLLEILNGWATNDPPAYLARLAQLGMPAGDSLQKPQ
jgi:hypothetical protein